MTEAAIDHLLRVARERARLDALRELGVLDTPPEQPFDDLAALAALVCQAPIALVSLVDADRQWFKARCGLDTEETPRELAFCAHAIEQSGVFEVPDAQVDPRFCANPLVTGEPHIRFYAGAPLVGRHGFRYGTLCVIDTVPRALSPAQHDGLVRLARRASDALETRYLQRRAEARETTLAQLLEAMPDGVVTCDADGLLREFNRAARDWHGVDPRALPPEDWAEHFDLFCADGRSRLATADIPLLRAHRGERVRDADIVIRAAGAPPRRVRCNAEALRAPDGTPLGAVCVMHDVTALHAAESAARLEAERFAEAFGAAAQGMALVSLDGRWLEVNDALCAMFGYSREELLALDFQRLTHPEDLQSDLAQVAQLLDGDRRRYQMEKRYFHKSGRVLHAHLSVSLVRDAAGAPAHFVSQIQDYTRRYRSECALRESEQKFRSVLEHTHDAFVACDESGCIVEWNRAAEVTFGWRRAEVLGQALETIIVPPRLRDAHREGLARYVRTGESRVLDQRLQLAAWHRSGREFPVELTISRVDVGSRPLFSAFLHDISTRLADKAALDASVTQLRTIADNVPALIAYVGPDLRYRFVNRAYAEWFGVEPEALVGRAMDEVLRPEHYAALQPRLEAVRAGQTVVFEVDVRDRHDALRHMRATYVPESGPTARDGAAVGFQLMVHDQTDHVRLARMLGEQVLRDDLTGLPNRAAWNEELDRALKRARRAGAPIAVMFLDLDGFKGVNDSHGHAVGDAVLRAFARALPGALRATDFVARLAGDEFVVLLDAVNDLDRDAPRIARKILRALAGGTTIDGHAIAIRPSIGIGVVRGPNYDGEVLMRCADEAMYAAKRARDGRPHIRECGTSETPATSARG
jgi:diguanylate cyclase (GGDEF)-like protein/PAS domain S-box-containing protein